MNEIITFNEVQNDGKTIHLYFNGLVGLYTAYGFSAFLLIKETVVNAAFSDSMQMPVVVLNTAHLEEVTKKLEVVTKKNGYYCLTATAALDENEYSKWVSEIRLGGINL